MKKRWLAIAMAGFMAIGSLFVPVPAFSAEVTTAEAQESETIAVPEESTVDTMIQPLVREQNWGDRWSMHNEDGEFPVGRGGSAG